MDFLSAKAKIIEKINRTGDPLIKTWIKLIESGHSPCELFIETGYINIVIALSSFVDETILLIEDLRRNNVNILYLIDDFYKNSEPFAAYGIDIINALDLPEEGIDFIITLSDEGLRRCNELLKDIRPIIEAVSLEDIINLEYDRLFIFNTYGSKLASVNRKNYVFGLAKINDFKDQNLMEEQYNKEFSRESLQANPPHFTDLYNDLAEYSAEYINQIFTEIPIIKRNNVLRHVDHRSEFMNIVNGHRITTEQPENYDNSIHTFGNCFCYGYGTDDKHTFASYLQRYVNKIVDSRRSWRIVNHGVWGGLLFENAESVFALIDDGEIKQGDIIIYLVFTNYHSHPGINQVKILSYVKSYTKKDYNIDFIYLYDVLREAHLKEKIYIDYTHFNHRGYRAIARHVFDNYIKSIIGGNASESVTSVDYSELPLKWKELYKTGHSPIELFNIGSSVLLYTSDCDNNVVKAFENELKSKGMTPEYIVDGKDGRLNADFIVDLAGTMDDETARDLRERAGTEIISLDEALNIVYDRYFVFEPIAAATAGVKCFVCVLGWMRANDLGADLLKKDYQTIKHIINNPASLTRLYEDVRVSPTYMKELLTPGKIRENSLPFLMEDRRGNFLNIKDGLRTTQNQPSQYDNNIHIFGGGAAFGVGADDRFTIASRLQEYANDNAAKTDGRVFRVINHGLWDGTENTDILNKSLVPSILDGDILPGDVVLYLVRTNFHATAGKKQKKALASIDAYTKGLGLFYVDLSPAIRLVEGKKGAFISNDYVNNQCYRTIATKVYMDCVKDFLDGAIEIPERKIFSRAAPDDDELSSEQNVEFRKYLEYLRNEKVSANGTTGAIVMNCNPFTLGHRYLAEQAASGVDFLYVFVVEEDKSFFPFTDRFRLVSEGLRDLKNVKVIRSGKFIISTITFPGYFTKDSASEVAVDTSLDLRLFGKYIVPALGIKTRFAGNEPTDIVTRQYNKAMSETLPQYGVEFIEFERITKGNKAISASNVRKLLEEKNMEIIRELVPEVTYKYLCEKFYSA